MRTQIRIVAGTLRGRKVTCDVDVNLRPTPQMVREALFSILGDAVPERPFFDVFAGTGVVGLEALSRGASSATFLERDFRLAAAIDEHIRTFGVEANARVLRTDVYRWAERWEPPAEPVNVFLSPPFADLQRRPEALIAALQELQKRAPVGSVIVLQSERESGFGPLPDAAAWEERRYGRNELWIWVKGSDR
jgi:16S rRNA (guanine966-N2)-methyltransferase